MIRRHTEMFLSLLTCHMAQYVVYLGKCYFCIVCFLSALFPLCFLCALACVLWLHSASFVALLAALLHYCITAPAVVAQACSITSLYFTSNRIVSLLQNPGSMAYTCFPPFTHRFQICTKTITTSR